MTTAGRSVLFVLALFSVCRGQAVISTVAGNGNLGFSGDGGPATSAALGIPSDMAVDSAGNVYIVDRNNNRIRKVDTGGMISTFAGDGTMAFRGDGAVAVRATLFLPQSVAVDSAGNVYIADTGNGRIRKVNTAGIISTVAGGGGPGGDGGPATNTLLTPDTVAVDSSGNLYITDNGTRIRKVNTSGIISTIAGSVQGFSGDGGPATKAALSFPAGLAFDAAGNLYFADKGNYRVRKIDTSGVITTVAGSGTFGFAGDGGPATSARLGMNLAVANMGVAVDNAGNLYIADPLNNRVRMVNPAGIISTFAGSGGFGSGAQGDGNPPAMASLAQPNGVAFDKVGNLYIADTNHNKIRRVTGISSGGSSPPVISVNGVVNGASFQPGIVANSWVTILGTNLAPKTDDWSNSVVNGQLPTSLDGVSVSMGGMPAYIYYITPTQINLLAPDLPPGPTSITVTTPNGTSPPVTATVNLYGPAFFPWPSNQPVATRPDYSLAVKPGTFSGATTVAAKPGDVIILWGTGFGSTTPAAPVGAAVPGTPVYSTATLPIVMLRSTPLKVLGAALASGSAGLYQIAVQLPTGIGDGNYQIQATIGGLQSPSTTMLTVCSTPTCASTPK
jgi:uncharacterized protein (TIGR03437 family)